MQSSRSAILGLTFMLFVPALARADCIHYGPPVTLGRLQTASYDAAVSGTLAYVAGGTSLKVIDVSNPASPFLIGSLDTLEEGSQVQPFIYSVAVSGNYVYAAVGTFGLRVIDVSNPASPALVGGVSFWPGRAVDVAVSGTVAYVAATDSGLVIIDVSNPASPEILTTLRLLDGSYPTVYAAAVAVAGSMVYVEANSRLFVIDVSNPVSPVVLGDVQTHAAHDVAVFGTFAYVADGSAGLKVIDVSNPMSPTVVGSVDTPGEEYGAFGVAVSGALAFLVDFDSSWGDVFMIDVSHPASPAIIGRADTPSPAGAVTVSGTVAYVSYGSGLQLIDASNPPAILGATDTPGTAYGVAVSETQAYVAAGDAGLQVINASDPGSPSILGNMDTPGLASGVAVSGAMAYVADGDAGLQVIDVSNPASPALLANADTPDQAKSVAVSGSLAYVADGLSGLQVIDASNPGSPVILGSVDTPGGAMGVALSGTLAYVADSNSGLQVIDVSDPGSPSIVGSVDTPGSASGVAVSGTLVYLADAGAGSHFYVIDVSDPTLPKILGTLNLQYFKQGVPYGIAVLGTSAYVADREAGLRVINISNPAAPTITGIVDMDAYAFGVATSGQTIYLANGAAGLLTLSAQCEVPTPVRLSSFVASADPRGILLEWSTSSETEFSGFHVHRSIQTDGGYERLTTELIRSGANYRFLDSEVTPGIAYYYRLEALDRTGNREFFGPVSARMEPREIKPILGQAFPNPFHTGSSTIPFTLPSAATVRIRVLDLAGREVRVLLDEVAQPGEQSVVWDGRDELGVIVPAGIYLYQLKTSAFEGTNKLIRLR